MNQLKSSLHCSYCDYAVPKNHQKPQSCLTGHLTHCQPFLTMKLNEGVSRQRVSTITGIESFGTSMSAVQKHFYSDDARIHLDKEESVDILEFRQNIEEDHVLGDSCVETPIVIAYRKEIGCTNNELTGPDMEPNSQYYKLQMLMEKEFYNSTLPFLTRGGKHLLDPAKDYEPNGEDLLPHLRRDDNAQELKKDMAHCSPYDYAALANLSLRMHMTVADGTLLLETLNDIMRDNQIAFRFPRRWRTINDAMRPFNGDEVDTHARDRVTHYTAPRFVDYSLDEVSYKY